MEVCVDSVESAINAEKGGALRVELCGNLMEGGTTPSIGMLKVVKSTVTIPVFVMIRPRGGDFLYSPSEFCVMQQDLTELKQAGADGIVLGILKQDGTIDRDRCRQLIAIDMTRDILEALETVISLGCEHVLTSGGDSTVLEGLPVIKQMIELARGRIGVVPGGGITERNILRILDESGAKEFHASARSTRESTMTFRKTNISMGASLSPPEFSVKVADSEKVKNFISLTKEVI